MILDSLKVGNGSLAFSICVCDAELAVYPNPINLFLDNILFLLLSTYQIVGMANSEGPVKILIVVVLLAIAHKQVALVWKEVGGLPALDAVARSCLHLRYDA